MRFVLKPLFIILTLVPLVAMAPLSPQAQEVYVDRCAFGGGDGSRDNPYNTLPRAVAEALPGSTLVVQTGTYPERFNIQKNLTITAVGGPVRIGQPLSTQRICQITGEFDKEWNVFTINRTETNVMLKGTDLGVPFEHNGRLYFLFGDTHPVGLFNPRPYDANELRPFNGDSIAWTQDTDPEQCVRLNFLRAPDGGYLSPRVRRPDGSFISLGGFEVPIGGFSAGTSMYVFFSTDHYQENDNDYIGRLVLARLEDETQNRFIYLEDVSCRPGFPCSFPDGSAKQSIGKFINVTPTIVNNADIPGLPRTTGQGVLLWGSGSYRESDPYLAYVPLDALEDPRMWKYAVTASGNLVGWSDNELDATTLFTQDCTGPKPCKIGELSVTWNPFLRKWLMLYGHGAPRGINYRVADKPWGPWSPPAVLFDPLCDRGYCYFMHANWDEHNCDSVHDSMFGAPREREWSGEYGPYVISRYTKGDATSTTIYWTMSTWNPYQVMLMKSTLQLSCACRTY